MYQRKIGDGGGTEPFHVAHKVPSGDGPYGRAKHAQLVDKDPVTAIVWFWKAINDGDRVDSALKDMAVVMKQIDRSEEAIEAIKSFRGRCSDRAQGSLDNLLIDLYKKCGMMEEHIELLKDKLRVISRGEGFDHGRTTKTARSHGKKFQVSLTQETSRILGNLGWAYMQLSKYQAAEAVYRKARLLDPDFNKCCNLALCLIKQEKFDEAQAILIEIVQSHQQYSQTQLAVNSLGDDKHINRVMELLSEIESSSSKQSDLSISSSNAAMENVYNIIAQRLETAVKEWTPFGISSFSVVEFDDVDCAINNCEVNL